MSSKKHSDNAIDLNIPYEQNEIQFKGIVGFTIGLVLLIVITFGLMWAFLGTLNDYWKVPDSEKNPLAMSEKERLPPEPRLQAAPGFGVESEKGWVNMELQAPQSEYRELKKQWDEMWEHGRKDSKTGTVSVMPIETAKEKFLAGNPKAKAGAEAEETLKNSRSYVTDASAGRLAAEKRR
ncbi:MAG: hypothetical protein IPL32_12830 [Chloracidobacterium sp.]|nr:hypothetical protein [Chloracidobacterium sp.]